MKKKSFVEYLNADVTYFLNLEAMSDAIEDLMISPGIKGSNPCTSNIFAGTNCDKTKSPNPKTQRLPTRQ